MTGGSWQDTDASARSKRKQNKSKRPARLLTSTHTSDYLISADTSIHDEDADEYSFRAEVDIADLRTKLRRWKFSRSWRCGLGRSRVDEGDMISPRSRVRDVGKETSCLTRAQNTIEEPSAPLDRELVGQYLERCVAAAESQLVGARSNGEKKRAVKEIERLVEKVVTEAGLGREG